MTIKVTFMRDELHEEHCMRGHLSKVANPQFARLNVGRIQDELLRFGVVSRSGAHCLAIGTVQMSFVEFVQNLYFTHDRFQSIRNSRKARYCRMRSRTYDGAQCRAFALSFGRLSR